MTSTPASLFAAEEPDRSLPGNRSRCRNPNRVAGRLNTKEQSKGLELKKLTGDASLFSAYLRAARIERNLHRARWGTLDKAERKRETWIYCDVMRQ